MGSEHWAAIGPRSGLYKSVKRDGRKYQDSIPEVLKTPAQEGDLKHRRKLHIGLRKAESSLAKQLRTEKVGFAAFLYTHRVSGALSPACQCGWRRQDPKHIIVFCPKHTIATRNKMYEEAGTRQYLEIRSTREGLRAVARWMMREDLLHQFSLAKEQIDRAERRATEGENAVEEDEETGEAINQASEFGSEMTRAE